MSLQWTYIHYLLSKLWLRPLAFFNRNNVIHNNDNLCVTKIKYIMYNTQYSSVVRQVVCEDYM